MTTCAFLRGDLLSYLLNSAERTGAFDCSNRRSTDFLVPDAIYSRPTLLHNGVSGVFFKRRFVTAKCIVDRFDARLPHRAERECGGPRSGAENCRNVAERPVRKFEVDCHFVWCTVTRGPAETGSRTHVHRSRRIYQSSHPSSWLFRDKYDLLRYLFRIPRECKIKHRNLEDGDYCDL